MSNETTKTTTDVNLTPEQPVAPAWNPTHEQLRTAVKTYELDNGLSVVLLQDNSLPTVFLSTGWRVGPENETLQTRGFATLIKYMFLKGTGKMPDSEVQQTLSECAPFNYSNHELAIYSFYVKKGYYKKFLSLLADRVHGIKFDQQQLAGALELMVKEIKQHKKQLILTFMKEAIKGVFPEGHKYHFPVLDYTEALKSVTVEQIESFYNQNYKVENCTLYLMGDFQEQEVIEQLEQELSCKAKECAAWTRPQESKPKSSGVDEPASTKEVLLYKKSGNPFVILACKAPGISSTKECFALGMLTAGVKEILIQRLEIEEKIANSIVLGGAAELYDQSILFISFSCAQSDIPRCIDLVQEEFFKAMEENSSNQEGLERVIEQAVKGECAAMLSSYLSLGFTLTCLSTPRKSDPRSLFDSKTVAQKIRLEDLEECRKKYFSQKFSVKITMLPTDEHSLADFLAGQEKEDILAQEILKNHPVATP